MTNAGPVLARAAAAALLLGGVGLACLAVWRREQRTREALRLSEERLRFALEATSEIVWDWNLAQDSIYHPRWAATYGYPPEKTPRTAEELGRFIHPEDLPGFLERIEEAGGGGRDAFEYEHRALAASGEWRWMVARARVVSRDGRGRALRMVGTCTDVTERRKLDARLQIADRLASVGTLAAGVAHEINNPLAYVMGNVQFAAAALGRAAASIGEEASPPQVLRPAVAQCCEALQEALEGAQRVRDIVRDLKVLSRVDDERRGPVSVPRVLRAALNLAAGEIRSRARVATAIEEVSPVLASESRLSQVFLNLLVNAAQAVPEGRADENQISVSARSGPEHRVVVEVRDTGCGIPAEHRGRIFDPFFTTKPPGVGTGLGLAICYGIVSSLGGEIDVESEVGRGSTFRVSLPATEAAALEMETPLPGPPPRRSRVLVVDDEPLFCRSLERLLSREHEVASATDPREALRRVRNGERFDLVLSDLVMPGMSGMELHAEISKISPELGERMLFVTGGAFTQAAADFAARNPERVLDKPISPDRLRAAVSGIVGHAPERGASPAARAGAPEDLAGAGKDR